MKSGKAARRGLWAAGAATAFVVLLWLFALPSELFRGVCYSTVVVDRHGELLGARIADDGQWRFPPCDSVPRKFAAALVEFEDRTFYRHVGVSLRAVARACVQNLRSGRIVSGASTLTMQVVRMARRRPRTFRQKAAEMFLATRLEARCTKEEILRLYASHAPFGGNVVGIDAAMWHYLGSDGSDLSWAEAATLAVLQNAPASIHLARNRSLLLEKRNRLLRRLADRGYLTESDCELSLAEPLIGAPQPLPDHAPHLVAYYDGVRHGHKTVADIDLNLQRRLQERADRWCRELCGRGVNDLAAVVVEVSTGKIAAYCGNADKFRLRPGVWVDIARAPRSSGSILKPLLYCGALQEGTILPQTLLPDVPVNYGGFVPQNFDRRFTGAVAADRALARSLNVPNVRLLREYGVERFASQLRQAGFSTVGSRAERYGLSLILGGAEVTLADVVRVYASLAGYYRFGGGRCSPEFPFTDRVAIYAMLEAMKSVDRPDELDMRMVSSVPEIAWKTGTSYGSRDAWAVGITPEYVVGVWAGNAQGQSAPDLTGARTAGPVMFDLFGLLPRGPWFEPPGEGEGTQAVVCCRSGMLAGPDCTETELRQLPLHAMRSEVCPYHRRVAVSEDGHFRVEDRSEPSRSVRMFILPPAMAWYYRQNHPEYRPLPPLRPRARSDGNYETMRFIYPSPGCVVSLPRQMDGSRGGVAFSLAHVSPSKTVYWHLDKEYVGSTTDMHKLRVDPPAGAHRLTVVDEDGNRQEIDFSVL